jgi:hypothetical protein
MGIDLQEGRSCPLAIPRRKLFKERVGPYTSSFSDAWVDYLEFDWMIVE